MNIFHDSQKKLRQLGSKLTALHTSLFPPLPHLLRAIALKIDDAAKRLLRLSYQYDEACSTVARSGQSGHTIITIIKLLYSHFMLPAPAGPV
jgi:hypothetical protein